jgi:hypothetical protein
MRIIKPVIVNGTNLLSSTVLENDHPEWSAAINYNAGQRVIKTATHSVYECLVGGGTGQDPAAVVVPPATVFWRLVGPTNKWAMFDQYVSTQTVAQDALTVKLKPGVCSSLAVLELIGKSLTVTATDGIGGPTIYSREFSLEQSQVFDGYTYCFEPFSQKRSVVITDLPPYLNAVINITVAGPGQVACGQLIVGNAYTLGSTESGIETSTRSYSRKKTDSEDRVTLEKRKTIKLLSAKVLIESGATDVVQTLLADLDSVPIVCIGDEFLDFDSLVIFGIIQEAAVRVDFRHLTWLMFKFEGFI